jgi:hypothetical protein
MNSTSLDDPPTAIAGLKFVRRQESWVAKSNGYFYKIVRKSDDPMRDIGDPECIEKALREYNDLRFLAGLSAGVCCPVRTEQGCIVYPYLSGPDLRDVLRSGAARARHQDALHDAMFLLAQFHRDAGNIGNYPVKDYLLRSYAAPAPDIIERIRVRKKTLVIGGFEVRNLRFDNAQGGWYFFDPHHVWVGVPEDDLARFFISLLMVNWGRDGTPRCWNHFNMGTLLATYERATSAPVDKILLNFFLLERTAMRKFFAMKTLGNMSVAARIIAWPYLKVYFWQIERWRSAHAI